VNSSYILGISSYFHDSAAALIKDGEVLVAIQEERLSRVKNDDKLPVKAIEFCLNYAHISIKDIELIAYYEKPFLKFERLIETQIWQFPFAYLPFRKTVKSWLREKLWVPTNIRKALGYKGAFFYAEHHESHAAAACYSSTFEECAYLTFDGIGEWATATIGIFENNKLTTLQEQKYPHSVGLLYSAFTHYCGFKVNSGEYKLMGLAAYGEPMYTSLIKEKLVEIHPDGAVTLNLKYFSFHRGMRMINSRFETLFNKKARRPESNMTKHYQNVAASIQQVLEEILLKTAAHVRELTGKKNLCYGGGVALNCKANQVLKESGIFESIHITNASGDSGGAIGSALLAFNNEKKRKIATTSPYLGKQYSDDEILLTLVDYNVPFTQCAYDELYDQVAQYLHAGKVVAWFQGRDEFGPRALGNRSILATPTDEAMVKRINDSVKFRESFRPFAPVVMEEFAQDYFENIDHAGEMLFTFNSKEATNIPACIHKDGTARVQTVNKMQNEKLYLLLSAFYSLSKVPVLINTSFNLRGEPLVHSPEDALRTFIQSGIDYLVINNFVIDKSQVANVRMEHTNYELD